jgi:hypothetical protein
MPYYHQVFDKRTGELRAEPMRATTHEEAIAELEREIHDCPECNAARARGEPTISISPPQPMRGMDRFRRPRWRDLKRRVRRGDR